MRTPRKHASPKLNIPLVARSTQEHAHPTAAAHLFIAEWRATSCSSGISGGGIEHILHVHQRGGESWQIYAKRLAVITQQH